MCDSNYVKFMPLNRIIDTAFWVELSKKKLNHYKLSEEMQEAIAYIDFSGRNLIGNVFLDFDSFDLKKKLNQYSIKVGCDIVVMNTKESFLAANKSNYIRQSANKFINGKFSELNSQNFCDYFRVLLVCYIDLKNYKFFYWFAYPGLKLNLTDPTKSPRMTIENGTNTTLIIDLFNENAILNVSDAIKCHITKHPNDFLYFWLIMDDRNVTVLNTLTIDEGVTNKCFMNKTLEKNVFLVFFDSSMDGEKDTLGWLMKPLIMYFLNHHPSVCEPMLNVISLKDFFNENLQKSLYYRLGPLGFLFSIDVDNNHEQILTGLEVTNNKIVQRLDLKSIMSPVKLAESNAELNLRLMTWRLAPHMNIDRFKSLSCLLIGAGTLGCNVARGLLGWGVQKITFIDNGIVSYSNPIRQSLYKFTDCVDGEKNYKALISAQALKEIAPFVTASGSILTVPTPGQLITDEEQIKADIVKLENHICDHDIIFLLTDTRESRWLPTVLSFIHHKVVINAAVGFDSFLVMRYSGPPTCESSQNLIIPSDQLACYFCSDPIIPQNTLTNRALDQQCTVSRPGISMMASAHAVEMFSSLVQCSDDGPLTVPYVQPNNNAINEQHSTVPHMVRFFLPTNHILTLGGYRYNDCVACSRKVLENYSKQGCDYIISVIKNPNLLKPSNLEEKSAIEKNNHNENNIDYDII